ncbi:cytochrome P450 [Streptomyces radiopugnans]|nr:cytochrome P450 [Streptomyces radiopugnans]
MESDGDCCVGAALAHMEARIALDLLAQWASGMRVAEDQDFDLPVDVPFRGPRKLLVHWPE